jgi:putative nucleotidyltransferase with HDIG domain
MEYMKMSSDEKMEIKDIPIMPQVATKILQLKEENLEISFKELENIILIDPALTSKILKVANSALYARQREIINLQQAIALLGFKMIKSLVLLVCASNIYGTSGVKTGAFSKQVRSKSTRVGMWRHLVLTAFLSKHLAQKLGDDEKSESIFIAGLLHDIGRIVFLLNASDSYETYLERVASEPDRDILSVEESIFGSTHQEVGKIVLQRWNFPDELIDAISHHHSEKIESPYRRIVEIVGLANVYARILIGESLSDSEIRLKESHMRSLAVSPDIDEYICSRLLRDLERDELYVMSTSAL